MSSDLNPSINSQLQQPPGLLHTLVILRHAQAQYARTGSDRDRPLTSEGEQNALQRGRELSGLISNVDRLLVSTAVRTRQTASLALPDGPEALFLDDIYDATAGTLIGLLENYALGCTALVGHNPGLSGLAGMLSGKTLALRPGDLVVVTFNPPANQPLQWSSGQITQHLKSG